MRWLTGDVIVSECWNFSASFALTRGTITQIVEGNPHTRRANLGSWWIEQQKYIRQLAQADDLTDLVSGNHFYCLLDTDTAHVSASVSGQIFGILFLYMYIYRFKPISDVFGQEAGTHALRGICRQAAATRAEGMLAVLEVMKPCS